MHGPPVHAPETRLASNSPTASSSRRCASIRPRTAQAGDWHMIHLGHLALSGAGLLILEATAVSPRGPHHAAGPRPLLRRERGGAGARARRRSARYSPIPVAIQLGACRPQGSSRAPWEGGAQIRPDEAGGWKTVAPSPVPHAADEVAAGRARSRRPDARARRIRRGGAARGAARPRRRSRSTARTATCCTSSCRRSPTSAATNTAAASRTACASRSRCSTRCARSSRRTSPVWMRISATDWVPDGWDIEGTVALVESAEGARLRRDPRHDGRRLAAAGDQARARATRCPMRSG